ncbi:MAG: hypothetical protein ABI901_14305 [Roseiflexaceae bacterium]
MDPFTSSRLAAVMHQEQLADAADARQWAQHAVTIRLRDRVRQAISARLIAWGERLYVPTPRVEVHS